jgi:hypothetical protein
MKIRFWCRCDSKMRKPGNGCNERDAYYFWNDCTDDQDKNFFKILVGDFHKRLVRNFLVRYICSWVTIYVLSDWACGQWNHYLLEVELFTQ